MKESPMIIINSSSRQCSFHDELQLPSGHYLIVSDIVAVKLLCHSEKHSPHLPW